MGQRAAYMSYGAGDWVEEFDAEVVRRMLETAFKLEEASPDAAPRLTWPWSAHVRGDMGLQEELMAKLHDRQRSGRWHRPDSDRATCGPLRR